MDGLGRLQIGAAIDVRSGTQSENSLKQLSPRRGCMVQGVVFVMVVVFREYTFGSVHRSPEWGLCFDPHPERSPCEMWVPSASYV